MDLSPDETAIRRVIHESVDAANRGEIERYAEHLDPDLTYFMTGVPPLRGRDAYITSLKSLRSQCDLHVACDIEEVQVIGDHAYCVTQLTVVLTPHHGSPRRRTGHTLAVLRRAADGHWRIFRDANLLPDL
jgi:uncharacterized protein (TIGR02246 family)